MSASLKRRLEHVANKTPTPPSAEQLLAYTELITYLDQLASRKARGDVGVQQEIELICRHLHECKKPSRHI